MNASMIASSTMRRMTSLTERAFLPLRNVLSLRPANLTLAAFIFVNELNSLSERVEITIEF